MARWFLVRHGETQWNAEERIQGQTDVPLHETGRREAALTGKRLSDVRFAAVYASDLGRTQETAAIILGAQSAQAPEVQTHAELREVGYGVFEGMTWSEIREKDGRMRDRQFVHDLDFAPPEGESFREVLARTAGFATMLSERHATDDVLVVAHGGSLRALAVGILGMPDEAFWQFRGLRPASISIVLQDGGVPALTAWNDVGHI
ncbi:MAG: histidine phosphatase family protein [Chloroflexi bacterium]|nr:histidine phosphatase family protein [Chloroflexota bacterium]MDA1173485.1 histidine phosphatase family protein [Chloroflexota bacterium]